MIDASEFCDFEDCACGVYPEDKFSGLLTETWPNGALKFRGEYKHGRMRVKNYCAFLGEWRSLRRRLSRKLMEFRHDLTFSR